MPWVDGEYVMPGGDSGDMFEPWPATEEQGCPDPLCDECTRPRRKRGRSVDTRAPAAAASRDRDEQSAEADASHTAPETPDISVREPKRRKRPEAQQPKMAGTKNEKDAAAALLSLPALCLRPGRASAFLGFGEGPQGEFRELGRKRAQLADLADQLEKKDLRGEVDEDAIVVLNTLTIQFRGTEQLLDKTTAALDRLAPDDIAKAQMISKLVLEELENVRQGARERAPRKQLSATEDAGNAIDKYLALAGTKYTLPEADVSLAYSSDPAKFAAQYYGVFSCEGQGLERVKGSNTCKDSKENNKNPFPTKKLLDFDFLTGETLPTNK